MSRAVVPRARVALAWAAMLVVALAACDRTKSNTEPPPAPATPAPATPAPATPAHAMAPTPAPEPASPPAPDHAQAAATLVGTVEALGELHARHADDCVALAGAIERFHAEHGASLAGAAPEVHAYIDADDELRSRMRAAMEPVMTAPMACRRDPTFTATHARLFGGTTQ